MLEPGSERFGTLGGLRLSAGKFVVDGRLGCAD